MRNDIIFHDMEQGSPEWVNVHLGRITSSTCAPLLVDGITEKGKKVCANIKRTITNLKNRKEPPTEEIDKLLRKLEREQKKHFDFGDGAWSLIYQIAGEIITGESSMSQFGNYWTDRGHELEDQAIDAYMDATFYEVNRVGFIELGKYAGCSPDGLVDEERGCEAKCLSAREHIRYAHTRHVAIEQGLPPKMYVEKDYYAQCQWSLFVLGFKYWDYIHFHPKAERWSLIVDTITPDEDMHRLFEERLELAAGKIEQIVSAATVTNLIAI